MPPVRLGAVSYLNARPLVFGLETSPEFAVRFDVPSHCAELLHAGAIDVGLIPSIEYLRPRAQTEPYAIVPDLAIASNGPVASVVIFTTRPMADVRSIALDTSSRTSVALVRVLCPRVFGIRPSLEHHSPDLEVMLAQYDAALIIGDNALMQDGDQVRLPPSRPQGASASLAGAFGGGGKPVTPTDPVPPMPEPMTASDTVVVSGFSRIPPRAVAVEKIDLGEVWKQTTGLPFVYAFWAGRPGCLSPVQISALQRARERGLQCTDEIARAYFKDAPERQPIGARYLRDNIKYSFGDQEKAGLELFFQYAVEAGVVDSAKPLRFY
jgi:predicted solute-binding protein